MSAGFASAGSSKMLLDVVELLLVPGHFKNSTVNSLFIFNLIHANWVDGQVSVVHVFSQASRVGCSPQSWFGHGRPIAVTSRLPAVEQFGNW